jgi:GTPase SAR1 family protein
MATSTSIELPSLQALQSADQMELLDIVDSLRAEGLGEITALPQLIVCGDQSSGKSSVLQAISGIPFPRKENTCTRFATEVILRRTPENRISVSIVPSRDRRQPDREQLLKFRHELSTPDDFPDLFNKAKEVMLNGPRKSFSKDILRVEFCGPSQPQLTLVDLPGLIHSHVEAELQTTEDVKLVTDLVSDYLRNPRSIILAIVSAKYDINVQVILNRAREVDPQGTRTLGIITKPDTLVKGSESEEAFIKLARNERVHFRLGWHVVKNLDSANKEAQETALETRDAQEKAYFKDSNFKSLPSHSVGITSLRAQLSKVLFHQIRFELPRLVEDIEQRISTSRVARDKLGPNRATIDEQRPFLIQLSQSFQTICQAAARGDYDHEFFQSDQNTERRLCANLMNKHFEFAEDLQNKGSLWNIVEAKANDEVRSRTREEAIKDAQKLLKRSRGREVTYTPFRTL